MTRDRSNVSVKHVPPLVNLCLAIAVTALVWIHAQALLWLTEETTVLAGVVVSLALWLFVLTAAGNRAKVRWLREAMRSIRTPGNELNPGTRARTGVPVTYLPGLCVLVLSLATTGAFRFDPTSLAWLGVDPGLVAGGVVTALLWMTALASVTEARHVRRLLIQYEGFKESEDLAVEMMGAVPIMVCVSLPDGNRARFNRHYLDLTGRTDEFLTGLGWLHCVHEDDRAQIRAMLGRPTGQAMSIEYGMTGTTGDNRWIREHLEPRFAPGGEIMKYIVTGIDITAQVETETEHEQTIGRLREEIDDLGKQAAQERKTLETKRSEELDALKAGLGDELASLKVRSKEEVANLKRRSREEVGALKTQHREEVSGLKTQLRDEVGGLKEKNRDEIAALKDKHREESETLKKEIGTLGEVRDRFEQRFQEAQETAQQAGEQLTVFHGEIAQAQVDLKSANADQKSIKLENRKLNQAIEKLQVIVGKMENEDADLRRHQSVSEKQIEHTKEAAAEARRNESQLRTKVNRLTVRVQRLEGELEEEQASIKQAKDEAARQQETMDEQIVAGTRVLAGELRPQLRTLADMAERLHENALDETQLAAVESAQASAAAMSRLVDGTLGVTGDDGGARAGRTVAGARQFDLRKAVSSVCELVGSSAAEKGVDVRCVIHPDFPPWVSGDSVAVREVMIHLLRRVVSVVDGGTINVTLADSGVTSSHVAARCEIKHDTAPFDAARLDELFALREMSGPGAQGPTDVGEFQASAAWRLIRSMKGEFGATAGPNRGFTVWFMVTLPKHEVTAAASAAPVTAPVAPSAPSSAPTGPETPRVPQEDLVCSLGPVLELGCDSAKVHCAKLPHGSLTLELTDDDETLTIPAQVLSSERTGLRGFDVVLRFLDSAPQVRQHILRLAMAHRRHTRPGAVPAGPDG